MKCLPHPLTITKWHRKVQSASGINETSLKAIKRKVSNLTMGEIKIKKPIDNVNGKEYGYIEMGKGVDEEEIPAAENALAIMVVCGNSDWKIPVAYYFITALSGEEKANIVLENLNALHTTGITITSITFDGLQSNITMCTKLGVLQTVENSEKQYFIHPITRKEVYIIYDGCHILKLVRNCIAVEDLYDSDGNIISWSYLKVLVDSQEINGLHAGNKLRRSHIN